MARNYKPKPKIEIPDLEGEIWTEVYGFPNYEISNYGRVKNIRRGNLVKPSDDGQGYYFVGLYYEGKRSIKRVARLVYDSFSDTPCNLTIDHINRQKNDDRYSNLRCITNRENIENKEKVIKNNKYNLTNELRGEIAKKILTGEWTTWTVKKKFGIPMKYTRNVKKRGSWNKFIK